MHVIITCKYEKDQIKKTRKRAYTVFTIITLSVDMETGSWIWPNFKFIQALMYVMVICKYVMDPIKNSQEKVATPFFPLYVYGDFFRTSRAAKSAVGGPIRPKFELVRALIHVIVICKYEKERMKNSREKVETPFSPIITLSVTMGTSCWIGLNFKLIQALMYVIITCKYEKDPINNSREKMETPFFSL